MNVFHLPGAIVGDPRCNCVMCERNRDTYEERLAERILAMPISEVREELAREGIDLTEAKQKLALITSSRFDSDDLPTLEELGEQEVESDEFMEAV